MDKKEHNTPKTRLDNASEKSPQVPYEPPRVKTYTSEEILEAIGPAQACSPSPCPVGN